MTFVMCPDLVNEVRILVVLGLAFQDCSPAGGRVLHDEIVIIVLPLAPQVHRSIATDAETVNLWLVGLMGSCSSDVGQSITPRPKAEPLRRRKCSVRWHKAKN